MDLSIVEFSEKKPCDNCGKELNTFHVRCEAGTLDADLCTKCLAKQCRMRAKAQLQKGTENNSLMNEGGVK